MPADISSVSSPFDPSTTEDEEEKKTTSKHIPSETIASGRFEGDSDLVNEEDQPVGRVTIAVEFERPKPGGEDGKAGAGKDDSDDDFGGRSKSKPRLRVGSKVKARYRGMSKFYAGVVTRDSGDGTFDIDYDDGDKETRVKEELIEAAEGGDKAGAGKDDSDDDFGGRSKSK
jgi:hypothetical protein